MTITDTHVYFWSGPFSNWHDSHILDAIDNSLHFANTEQAFMWYKAMFFQDLKTAALIEKEISPSRAKQLGRQVNGYRDDLWSCVRLGYMQYVNYLKFSQHEDLKKILLDTGSKILVEASPYDKIWGIGVGIDDAILGAPWNGQNLLGIALMNVRELIKLKK